MITFNYLAILVIIWLACGIHATIYNYYKGIDHLKEKLNTTYKKTSTITKILGISIGLIFALSLNLILGPLCYLGLKKNENE